MPHHGEERPRFMICGADVTTFAANRTAHYPLSGVDDFLAIGQVEQRAPFDCVISELRANTDIAPGVGETFTYTLMVESAPSALTCQTVDPNLESQDLVNEVRVNEDDRLALRLVTSAAAGLAIHRWSLKIVPIGE